MLRAWSMLICLLFKLPQTEKWVLYAPYKLGDLVPTFVVYWLCLWLFLLLISKPVSAHVCGVLFSRAVLSTKSTSNPNICYSCLYTSALSCYHSLLLFLGYLQPHACCSSPKNFQYRSRFQLSLRIERGDLDSAKCNLVPPLICLMSLPCALYYS